MTLIRGMDDKIIKQGVTRAIHLYNICVRIKNYNKKFI